MKDRVEQILCRICGGTEDLVDGKCPLYPCRALTDSCKQISQLYEPQGDRLLTNEEIVARWGAPPTTGTVSVYRSIAKAQHSLTAAAKDEEWEEKMLALVEGHAEGLKIIGEKYEAECQAKLEQVFAEIETLAVEADFEGSDRMMWWKMKPSEWQALKQKYLGGE